MHTEQLYTALGLHATDTQNPVYVYQEIWLWTVLEQNKNMLFMFGRKIERKPNFGPEL